MRYERLRRLGGGETAETYLCRDRWRGGRLVAQKVFSLEWSRYSPDLIDHEFRILSGISHPHVASIEDFGQEGESLYLVSEFVDGKTILEHIDHTRDADVHEIVALFFQVFEALDHLYFRNIVHLDLKPENILVRPAAGSQAATVKLIDFGLATLAFGLEASPSGALGSPPFTAPELAIGRTVDARSDLYSVGALLYTALSGRPPYDGDELIEILNQQLKKDPQPLCEIAPRVSPNLSSFVHRLMAREIGNRFENPRSALHAFGEALGESFPVAQAAPIPLFEDPDLIFRGREFEDLYQKIRDRGGRWAIRGGAGMGKTFLARWLERAFWKERRPVVAWSGERLVLAEDERSAQKPQSVVIIDDADQGPVAEWVTARGYKTVVALGEKIEGLSDASWTQVVMEPLDGSHMERILKPFGNVQCGPAAAWMKSSGGIPRDFVRLGRALFRKGVLRKEGAGWRWDMAAYDPSDTDSVSVGGPKKRLLKILAASRISLEADMLALWTDQSVAEVEELLAELLKDGVLEKFVEAGRVNYRAADVGARLPEDDALAADPERLARVLEKFYDEGRYRDGLELWTGRGWTPELLRLRAKLLANAGFHEEAIAILSDGFLSGDDLETRGKAFLFAGRMDEAARDLEAARVAAEQAGDTDGLARALLHQGILRQRAGERDKAKEIYERVLGLAPKTEQPALIEGTAALNLANLFYNLSDWVRAEEFYQRSLECLKETGHGAVTAQANLNYAALAYYQGKLLKAAHLCREALRQAVDHRYDLTQGRALLLLAMIHEKEGRPLRQDERLAEAVSIFSKAGLAFELSQALIHRAYFYESGGRLEAAESDARQALSQAEAIGAADLAAQARLILGKTLGVRGGKEEAMSCVEAALRHFTAHQNLPMQQECDAVLRSLREDSHE